ncbi:DUF7424 family protein [Pasteurella multocida]|uniref:DUF7424 family protein n=1 Tax=Pasteurella multocida TaxID=747 RepID=UPI00397814F8
MLKLQHVLAMKTLESPSTPLIQIQQKITNVFDNAVYKECYQKNFNSFASFEIAISVGKLMIVQR